MKYDYEKLEDLFDLTKDKVDNLVKLAEYLEKLPEDYQYFGMKDYIIPIGLDSLTDAGPTQRRQLTHYALNNGGVHTCGTAACAVGHGPSAGILFREEEIERDSGFNPETRLWDIPSPLWNLYVRRAFLERTWGQPFEFLFGGEWSKYDDTHRGAAARIRFFLHKVEVHFTSHAAVELYQEYIVHG